MQRIEIILTIVLMYCLGTSAIGVEAHDAGAVHPDSASSTISKIAALQQKAWQHPRVEQGWVNLGNALMQRARETGEQSDYPRAQAAFQRALRLNPVSSAAMIGMAWVHGALHQFKASIKWAERAIAVDPTASDAYGLLGDAAVEMRDYDAAFDHYQAMLDIRPDLASYSRGAHLLFVTGESQPAIHLMRKAIAAGGPYAENTAWCRAELARMLVAEGNLQEAEAVIQRGLRHSPHNRHLRAVKAEIDGLGRR